MEDAEQLSEFMDVMASFTPTIPEELVEHYLHQVGFTTSDPRIVRMIALAAHKFVLDVSHDAMQCQRIRAQNPANPSSASSAIDADVQRQRNRQQPNGIDNRGPRCQSARIWSESVQTRILQRRREGRIAFAGGHRSR
ncbi:hypothetical protein PINS_up006713 [Pythium insidiosum]|nr:hypothetical protein PINS_up006713 [Pythium insidiosum]